MTSQYNTPIDRPGRRWWRYLVQFSLRSLLIVTTLSAVACWWFITPQTVTEATPGRELNLRRQVRSYDSADEASRLAVASGGMTLHAANWVNVGKWQLRDRYGGLLVDGRYDKHLPHGLWSVYHANGRLAAKGTMYRAAKDGIWRTWNDEGQLTSEFTYMPFKTEQHFAGMGTSPIPFDEYFSRRNGPARVWHPTGTLKSEGNYQEDQRHGFWAFYDEQGRVTSQGEYITGQRYGRWLVRDEASDTRHEVTYVGGRLQTNH